MTDNELAILESIEQGSCILILGPLFGINSQENKINLEIRRILEKRNYLIDDDYQNLFVLKNVSNLDFLVCNNFQKAYKEISPNRIYDQVAKINFSAIITFTQDIFLLNAFKQNHF